MNELILLYFCAHFVFESDKKYSHNGGFKYDSMMINDSGLLFLDHPVYIGPEASFKHRTHR